jgi:hypothetical protein
MVATVSQLRRSRLFRGGATRLAVLRPNRRGIPSRRVKDIDSFSPSVDAGCVCLLAIFGIGERLTSSPVGG